VNTQENNQQLLIEYFQNGSKSKDVQKLGLEVEHFIVKSQSLESLSYYGENGIRRLLETLSPFYPHRFEKDGYLLGLYNDEYSLSLEPAGQLEISINPKSDIKAIEVIYQKLLKQIESLLSANDERLVTLGYQPKSVVEDLTLIPKQRYKFMDRYFAESGTGGIHMMRGTASTQVSIDYHDEADFVLKYRAAYILMPLLLLLTDNAPIYKGQPYHGHLLRNHIWERVDNSRTGMIKGLFDEDFGFAKYTDYLLNLPLIFMLDGDTEEYTQDKTISEIRQKDSLTREDIEHVLSMTFLDVRLKNYIEIRFADSMPFEYVKGYLALIKGVFYNESLLQKINNQYQASETTIKQAKANLTKDGFEGLAYGYQVDELLVELLSDAKFNLSHEEAQLLEPLELIVKSKRTLAEEYNEKNIN